MTWPFNDVTAYLTPRTLRAPGHSGNEGEAGLTWAFAARPRLSHAIAGDQASPPARVWAAVDALR